MAQGTILVLVDQARPERLGELVRALLPAYPELEVHTDVRAVHEVPARSVLVLAPRPEDATWLNLERPVFQRRALRVVLWCDAETTRALAQDATDFFDWVSHTQDCPEGPAPHAVAGLRCALAARAPGIIWSGAGLLAAFRAAFPGRTLEPAEAGRPYAELLAAARGAGPRWIAWSGVDGPRRLQRLRWALAEARRRTRQILVDPASYAPGWWPIESGMGTLHEARARLALAGAGAPGRLAALAGLEREAIVLLASLLEAGVEEGSAQKVLAGAADPGAEIARLAQGRGLVSFDDIAMGEAPRPALRAFCTDGRTRAHRRELLRRVEERLASGMEVAPGDIAWWAAWTPSPLNRALLANRSSRARTIAVEANLRCGAMDAAGWRALAEVALAAEESDAAEAWMLRGEQLGLKGREDALSAVRSQQGDYAEAEDLLRRSLMDLKATLGDQHDEVAASLRELGMVLMRRGQYSEAERCIHNARAIQERMLGPEHAETAASIHALGLVFQHRGRYAEAEEQLRSALAIQERALGQGHPACAATLHDLGAVLAARGDRSEAEGYLRKALAIQEEAFGPSHPACAKTRRTLAKLLREPAATSRASGAGKGPPRNATSGSPATSALESQLVDGPQDERIWDITEAARKRAVKVNAVCLLIFLVAFFGLMPIVWIQPNPGVAGALLSVLIILFLFCIAFATTLKALRTALALLEKIRRWPNSVVWIDALPGSLTLRTDQGRSASIPMAQDDIDAIVPLLRARCPNAVVTTDPKRGELKRRWRRDPASLRGAQP